MNERYARWSLGTKLTLVGLPFLLLGLMTTVATLWVSWQLDGGAAAVNEAGRMRMQAYRMALVLASPHQQEVTALAQEFEASLGVLRHGDAERPLYLPIKPEVRNHFSQVEQKWQQFEKRWVDVEPTDLSDLRVHTLEFVKTIDNLVSSIEVYLVHWTAILHMLQMGTLVLVVVGSMVLLFTGYLFVLEPVHQLNSAIKKIQAGDLGARVERISKDEFGHLADGFNTMAEHLQQNVHSLESKVLEKTAELEDKRERLQSLYEVTAMVARATTLDELAHNFVRSVMHIARADAVALRWADSANQRFFMMASHGLPASMLEEERCLQPGACHCGSPSADNGLKVIPIHALQSAQLKHCAKAGFGTVLSVPVRLHERLMGELDLFFHARVEPSDAERSLLEALNSHLASAMENLRLNALGKEAAVAEERTHIARELHDSIAQSLAFLRIQVERMRKALHAGEEAKIQAVLNEIDAGVHESYGDVRELLIHFRTRANAEDIEPALATTLRKFEHQTGIQTSMNMTGHGMPLSPDVQIQVLHIVQEALSNVRKHGHASHVWLDVQQQPVWRFEVRDNGIGFDRDAMQSDETHVGLRIMQERAQRIGAGLEVLSTPQHGSSVIITLSAPVLPD
jgi:two-component system nitrate/nitrite sensor histidine kinase NarX